jgi:phenylacetate-coenzyme A ligase PaaK-like adenylate-forming protein
MPFIGNNGAKLNKLQDLYPNNMPKPGELRSRLFKIRPETGFNEMALDVFRYQYENNRVYRSYVDHLGVDVNKISHYTEIPFLPIAFFKSHQVVTGSFEPQAVFSSSGTTGSSTSRHYIKDPGLYEESFLTGFRLFFGEPEDHVIIGLLPSYLERKGSSLVYMTQKLIDMSGHEESGFYLHDYEALHELLKVLKSRQKRTILLGVTYALLNMAESFPLNFPELIVMETGGMKGRRKEMVREELHQILRRGFGVRNIYSEYGMTELLSQAYSKGNGLFSAPPWMKVLIRDANDPFTWLEDGRSGGVNVIDLANIHSCSFIETQDLGKKHPDGSFEVLGRFDNSDVRGCNLLVI